jgi:hypothetical protein
LHANEEEAKYYENIRNKSMSSRSKPNDLSPGKGGQNALMALMEGQRERQKATIPSWKKALDEKKA